MEKLHLQQSNFDLSITIEIENAFLLTFGRKKHYQSKNKCETENSADQATSNSCINFSNIHEKTNRSNRIFETKLLNNRMYSI